MNNNLLQYKAEKTSHSPLPGEGSGERLRSGERPRPGERLWLRQSTERISTTVLYTIIGVVAVVFAGFFLIGFDMEQPDLPGFNAPLLTGALIALMWMLLVVAVCVFGVSVVRGFRVRGKEGCVVNGVPAARIAYLSLGTMVLLLVLSFAFAPTDSVVINGQPFADGFWLRVSEMFVFTSLALIVIAVGAVLFGFTRYQRKR